LNAERLLWTSPSFFEVAEYHFYSALSRAASCNSATDDSRQRHFEALAAHQKQHEIWAQHCPENFENRAALVGAEMARIEGRVLEAEYLYERAIHSAHANGFVHNEALANELAARFYAARGFKKIAHAYLQDARYGYLRWGATGKVRQLDQLYPHLRAQEPVPGPTSTIEAPVDSLDLATVLKVSQAVSGEIVLEKLLDTLMRTAIEHAGATRGLLLLPHGAEQRIEAEATTSGDTVIVYLRGASVAAAVLPESIVHYVVRTHESVMLGDASVPHPFSADPYLRQQHTRSLLCVPLINQTKLIGVLYLENHLTSHVFTPTRVAVLTLLASQAAISLENTRLYGDLEAREAQLRRLVDANIIGICLWHLDGQILEANDAFLRLVGSDREELVSGRVSWREGTPDTWRAADEQALAELAAAGSCAPFEKEYVRKDGSRVPVLIGAALFEGRRDEGVAFVLDLSERKRAELRFMAQYTVTQLLAETATLEDVTPKILQAVCEFLLWDLGALWSIDRQAGVLRCVEVWHKASIEGPQFEAITRASTFLPGVGLPGRVWSSREPAYIPDVVQDTNFARAPIAAREGLHAAFGFPILLGGDVLGVMEFFSHEIRQPDRDLLHMMATIGSQIGQFIERKRAEEALHHAHAELAHMTRVATLGELTASIAHEITQPLGAVVNNASACVRWLAAQNLEEARQSAARVVADGHRAAEIIRRIRGLAQKAPPHKDWLDLNATICDVLALARSAVQRHGVVVETHLAKEVPRILGDRIQLQQVLLNLIMNAIEAMSSVGAGPRALWVNSERVAATEVVVAVRDSGPGFDPQSLDRLFEAFYTTKPHGLGLGLAISRRIIEAHGGRLWATAHTPHGAVVQFTVPIGSEGVA
jgi:PAS domain S-box-containing protein